MDDLECVIQKLSSQPNLKKRKAEIDNLDSELKNKYPKLFELLSQQKNFDINRFKALCNVRRRMSNMDDKDSHIEAGKIIFDRDDNYR